MKDLHFLKIKMTKKINVDLQSEQDIHPPFQEDKNFPKLKDCQIFYVIRVLGYSNTGVH